MEKGVKKTVRFKQAYELRSKTRANEKRFKERNSTSGEPRHIKQVIRFTSCVTEDRVQEVSPVGSTCTLKILRMERNNAI